MTATPDVVHAERLRVLVARVGQERLALPVSDVLEALESPAVAPVPLAPPALLGQCAWRERWIPLLDLATIAGVPRAANVDRRAGGAGGPAFVALVVRREAGEFALRVDDVEEVLAVDPAAIRAVPPGGEQRARLAMLVRTDSGLVAVLDAGALRAAAAATLQGGEAA